MTVLADAHALQDDMVAFRRDLHRHPEIGLVLPRTQQKVLDSLSPLHLAVTTGDALSSVTGVLRGANDAPDRPRVLLRADMDALPVQERADVPFRSTIDGAMHACGHDLHTSMLLGAAHILNARRHELPGDVVFMFQPGEEGLGGGRMMVEEGVLDAAGRRVDAAYALHVFTTLAPHGVVGTRAGTVMAASDGFAVTVRGRGGHGSTPWAATDPVPVACEIVSALQSAVTRRVSIFDPAVVTVGILRAGNRRNIIPDEAYLEATVRTFSEEQRAHLRELLPQVAQLVAAAHGCMAEATFIDQYPATVNDPTEAAFAGRVVRDLLGPDRMDDWEHGLPTGEDFSFVLREVPGAFLGLSAVPAGVDPAQTEFNHSPRVVFDDAVLADGAALYAELALRRLHELAG